jgi:hypothetical protein
MGIVSLLLALLLPAVQGQREVARRIGCTQNMRQMVIAFDQFTTVHRQFPQYAAYEGQCVGNLSGHVHLLPYLDQTSLYNQIDLSLPSTCAGGHAVGSPPWEYTPWPAEVMRCPVPVFKCPSDDAPPEGNSFRACRGTVVQTGADWEPGQGPMPADPHNVGMWGVVCGFRPRRPAEVRDGVSQTVFFSERVTGDGNGDHYTPFRDVARWDGGDIVHPNDVLTHCAAISHPDVTESY